MEQLSAVIGLLVALSVAAERLVEIVKGFTWGKWGDFLKTKSEDPITEGRRRAILQTMAVVAGVLTAFLARAAIPAEVFPTTVSGLLALGLLASGGSGLWSSLSTYILEVKNLREALVKEAKARMALIDAVQSGKAPPVTQLFVGEMIVKALRAQR
jgi:MFS family permease